MYNRHPNPLADADIVALDEAGGMAPHNTLRQRSWQIFTERLREVHTRTDRLFAGLLAVQWLCAIATAYVLTPRTWSGSLSEPHLHLYAAVLWGGLLASLPILMTICCPGRLATRLVISAAQAGYSILFIHLSGGRIETHFHVFGSLAILAMYRDYRALIPATVVIALDHLIQGCLWPQSVFGVLTFSPWRVFEHSGWILFEDAFLAWSCISSVKGFWNAAESQARLELTNSLVENKIALRTRQVADRTKKLEESHRKEVSLRNKLLQAQRLESIGQLAAGVAHEINTPMQYVNDNVEYLSECTRGLFTLLDAYERNLSSELGERAWDHRICEIESLRDQCHFDYMRAQIPQAIEESLEGIQRVITIVRAMKEFSHPGAREKVSTDINQALRTTTTISKNRWKYCADMVMELCDDLPDVKALPSELNQVFLNLVVNASDAIASRLGDSSGQKGLITLRTYTEGDYVVISVHDTGCGITDEIRHRIYDPFFTTKEVGKGTGQGLAISHDIIVNKHGGQLDFDSTPGMGSTFYIRLPAFTRNQAQADDQQPTECLVEA